MIAMRKESGGEKKKKGDICSPKAFFFLTGKIRTLEGGYPKKHFSSAPKGLPWPDALKWKTQELDKKKKIV